MKRTDYGNVFNSAYVDEYGEEVKRTKMDYPYSYDGFVVYRMGENKEVNHTIYSDRLKTWYTHETYQDLSKKHFGDISDYFTNRSPQAIENFLKELTGKNLKLILIMEYCNRSSGYPVWRFDVKIDN